MMKRMVMAAGALLTARQGRDRNADARRRDSSSQVLVKVNGDIVTKTEYRASVGPRHPSWARPAVRQHERRARSSCRGWRILPEIAPDLILAKAVDGKLLLVQREAASLNYALERRAVQADLRQHQEVEQPDRKRGAVPGRPEAGRDLEVELRRNLERSMMVTQVQRNEVVEDRRRGRRGADVLRRAPDGVHDALGTTLQEILIEVPSTEKGINAAQDDEARAKANEIRKRLLGGSRSRVSRPSQRRPSKANGGLIGPIKSEELAPQLQQMLEKLRIGDVARGHPCAARLSDPQAGRTDTKIRTFEEARQHQ